MVAILYQGDERVEVEGLEEEGFPESFTRAVVVRHDAADSAACLAYTDVSRWLWSGVTSRVPLRIA